MNADRDGWERADIDAPYDYWDPAHAEHHALAGLGERGVGDITTFTVAEYERSTPWRRLGYRLYRHPLVDQERRPS